MLRFRAGMLAVLGLLTIAPAVSAQSPFDSNFNFDPFTSFYGYFVPRQQVFAAQRAFSSTEMLNQNAAERRYSAATNRQSLDRSELYNYEYTPLEARPFTRPPTILTPGASANVPMTSGYFSRTARSYSGALRTGAPGTARGNPARQVKTGRFARRGGGGMGGMGGMGMGGFGGGFGGGFR